MAAVSQTRSKGAEGCKICRAGLETDFRICTVAGSRLTDTEGHSPNVTTLRPLCNWDALLESRGASCCTSMDSLNAITLLSGNGVPNSTSLPILV